MQTRNQRMSDYASEWRDFTAVTQQLDQPQCEVCGIRHASVDWHPYCLTARHFYQWLHRDERKRDNVS